MAMNPAALLGKLKPDLSGLAGKIRLPKLRLKLPFGKKRDDDDDGYGGGYGGGYGDDEKPRRRMPWGMLAGVLVPVGLIGGLGWWVYSNADATRAAWLAGAPSVTIEIAGAEIAGAGIAKPPPTAAPPPDGTPQATAPLPPPPQQGPVTLTPAPAQGLVEESRHGPLPKVADDGRRPWRVYARPFPANDQRPRVAVVIADMGLSGVTTGNALQRLPAAVTLAFTPHAERLESWVERAREKGHEVMLTVPMEPFDFPRSDSGPNTLLTRLTPDRNIERLEWAMGRFLGYVGVTTITGGKFAADVDAMRPVIDALKARGLLYLDPGLIRRPPGPALAGQNSTPRAQADNFIDRDLSRGAIDDRLRELETLAKENGAAVGIGLPYPTTIERVELWARTLADRGVALAPVSAVVDRQKTLTKELPPSSGKSSSNH